MNNRKLFIGSLPWSVDDAKLAQIFSQAGTVVSAQVIKDRETGRSRGFGFVKCLLRKKHKQLLIT